MHADWLKKLSPSFANLPTSSLHLLLNTWAEKAVPWSNHCRSVCMQCAEVGSGDQWSRMAITILPLGWLLLARTYSVWYSSFCIWLNSFHKVTSWGWRDGSAVKSTGWWPLDDGIHSSADGRILFLFCSGTEGPAFVTYTTHFLPIQGWNCFSCCHQSHRKLGCAHVFLVYLSRFLWAPNQKKGLDCVVVNMLCHHSCSNLHSTSNVNPFLHILTSIVTCFLHLPSDWDEMVFQCSSDWSPSDN